MRKNREDLPTVKLADGSPAINLVTTTKRMIAVVDYETLIRLTQMLNKAHFVDIRQDMISTIEQCTNMNDYLLALEEEIAFHKTVNMIHTIQGDEVNMGEEENVAAIKTSVPAIVH